MNVTLKKNKKGLQLNQAFGAVLVLVSVAVLVIMAIFIFVSLGDSSPTTTTSSSQTILTQSTSTLTPIGDGVSSSSVTENNQTFLNFDGEDDYVNLGIHSINLSSGITINTFAKTEINSTGGMRLFDYQNNSASTTPYLLFYLRDNSNILQARLRLALNSSGCDFSAISTGFGKNDSEWHFYSGTFNGSALNVYVDGVLNKTQIISNTCIDLLNSYDFSNTNNLTIGRAADGNIGQFNGTIDYSTVYERPLTLVQISNVFKLSSWRDESLSIPVLMYHDIVNITVLSDDVNVSEFSKQMNYLNQSGYTTITDIDYHNYTLGKFSIPNKPIMFVFDDGFNSTRLIAAEIMDNYNYSGVSSVITSSIQQSDFHLKMNWTQLSELINDFGWSIASHSVSHCNFIAECNNSVDWINEFSLSKSYIQSNISFTPISFVYPNNKWNSSTMNYCRLNYSICFGFAFDLGTDSFININSNLTNGEMKRLTISNLTTLKEYDLGLNFTSNDSLINLAFNENNGTIAHDLSGNGNNGTIIGATWNTDGILNTLTAGTDYSIGATTGLFTILNSDLQWSEMFASWNYISSSAIGATDDLIEEFSAYTSLIGLLGTIIFLALVIGVLVASFVFSGRKV